MENRPIITEWLPDGSLSRGRLESEICAQIRLSYNYWKLVFETETPALSSVVIDNTTQGFITNGQLFGRAIGRLLYYVIYTDINVLHFVNNEDNVEQIVI